MPNQDPHAKQLLTSYPHDTVELFAPDLLQAHGEVTSIESVSSEIFNPDPKGRSGFLDIALKCTFADGSEHILLLIEHWSAAKAIDQRRMVRYWAELLWRHPKALVLPIMLVTDATLTDPTQIPQRFTYAIAGAPVADIHFRVHVVNQDWQQRIAATRNVVAIVLWVVPEDGHPVERCLEAIAKIIRVRPHWGKGALGLLLVCLAEFARLQEEQIRELHQRLQGDPAMSTTLVDLIEAEGLAKGKAEGLAKGKAEGEIAALLSMVNKGRISTAIAREQLDEWLAEGEIPQDMHDAALKQLGA